MNQSTRDEPQISTKEFSILKEIVKDLPDISGKASLESATVSYEKVLGSRGIDVLSDKIYFGALLRLNHYEGTTWPDKLLRAAAKIDARLKSSSTQNGRGHRRVKSDAAPAKIIRDASNRSVLQQKLDRGGHLSRTDTVDRAAPPREVHSESEFLPKPLTQEDKYVLVERYKLFTRRQWVKRASLVLAYWRDITRQTQDLREDQWVFAVEKDHGTLVQQGFEIWQDAFYAHIDAHQARARKANLVSLKKAYRRWESHVIERRQGQFLARVAAEKQALFDALVAKNKKKLLRKSVRRWRQVTGRYRSLESRALIVRDKRTQLIVWKSWFFRTCENKTAAIYDRKLQVFYLSLWVARTRHIAILIQRADMKREEDLLCAAWDTWRVGSATKESSKEVAEQHDTRFVLQNSLRRWHHEYVLAQKSDHVQAQTNMRLLSTSIVKWTSQTRARQCLLSTAENARLRTLFRAWRREKDVSNALALSNRNLLRSTFDGWLLRSRASVLQHSLARTHSTATLSWWSAKFLRITDRLAFAEDEVLTRQDRRISQAYCLRWQGRLAGVVQAQAQADEQYTKTLARSAMAALGERLEECRFQHKRALRIELKNANKKFFRLWFQRLIDKKVNRRETARLEYTRSRDARALQHSLQRWRQHTRDYAEAHSVANELFSDRQAAQLLYFFTAWNDRHQDIFEMERMAYDHDRARVAVSVCATLDERFTERRLLAQEADEIWSNKVHVTGLDAIRRWRRRYLRHLEKERQADLWADVFEKRLQRTVFRRWLADARGLRGRGRTYVGDASSDSLDASRTRVQWNEGSAPPYRRSQSILESVV